MRVTAANDAGAAPPATVPANDAGAAPPAVVPATVPAAVPATDALLRRCLIVVAALSTAGTAIELAMLRHWKPVAQLVPWLALALLAVATAILARRPSRRGVVAVRAIAAAVGAAAAFGVFAHVSGNYESGPLDYRYMETWATMPEAARWWAAISKTVGPAPALAPGTLAQAALALVFATVRHPALKRSL